MPCPDCSENHDRATRAEAAEQSLLLFVETFSNLARQLAEIEREAERKRHAENPPPPGAVPVPKKRFLLVPAELIAGLAPPLDDAASLSADQPACASPAFLAAP